MGGTVSGGKKSAAKILARDPDFFRRIGSSGGSNGKGEGYQGGFADTRKGSDGLTGFERASKYGEIGGRISRRGAKLDPVTVEELKTVESAGKWWKLRKLAK